MVNEMGFDCFLGLSEKAIEILNNYKWPGNVRELKNVIERAIYINYPTDLPIDHIQLDPFESQYSPRPLEIAKEETRIDKPDRINTDPINLKDKVYNFEKELINKALKLNNYNQKKTASYLGLT